MLEEVHRDDRSGDWCSGACRLAQQLGFYSVFGAGPRQRQGQRRRRHPLARADHLRAGDRAALLRRPLQQRPARRARGDDPARGPPRHRLARCTSTTGSPCATARSRCSPSSATPPSRPRPSSWPADFNTSPFTWISHVVLDPHDDAGQPARGAGAQARPRHAGHRERRDEPLPGHEARRDLHARGFETTGFSTSNAEEHLRSLRPVGRDAPRRRPARRRYL